MKIKLLLLTLLLLAGIVLGSLYYQQHKVINSSTYTDNLALINQVKQTNAALNILLLKSRYGLQADYDELARNNIAVADSIKAIENSDLARYFERDKALAETFKNYSSKVIIRTDVIENFKAHNAVLRNSIKYAPPLGDRLVAELKAANNPSSEVLESVNQALYRWALYSDIAQADFIKDNAPKVLALSSEFDDDILLLEYHSHIMAVVNEQERTQLYLENALSVDLELVLDELASQYTQLYLDSTTRRSTHLNYVILAYGLLTLLIAVYFAWGLRKSYVELEDKVTERTREIDQAYSELKESQEHLVQSEKMAALGQMVAGVAHEINTPLGYVSNNIFVINDLFDIVERLTKSLGQVYGQATKKPYDKKRLSQTLKQALSQYRRMHNDGVVNEAKELLTDSAHGLSDISEIVKNLSTFSRMDNQVLERFDVCQGLNSTLKVANSTLRQQHVTISKKYKGRAFIEGSPSKINQVFLNIITNAAQAMPESGGQLFIDVKKTSTLVTVQFKDTGMGMSEQARAKVFDPFFTTKPIGQGTGLGMSISYTIIKEHGGSIDISSKQGQGTVVTVTLPAYGQSVGANQSEDY